MLEQQTGYVDIRVERIIASQVASFLSSLLNIVANTEHFPMNLRWLAAVVAKNSLGMTPEESTLARC